MLNIIFMIIVVFATLYPLYYVAIVSLSHGSAVLTKSVKFFPVDFTLESYALVFKDPATVKSLFNSVLYTSVGTFVNLACTALCAYPLSRRDFSGRTFFTWMVTVTMFFSGGLIPLYLLILKLGLMNTMWAVILPVAINPWYMFMLRTYFEGTPQEIYDAANIDGASQFQILCQIALPLAKPVLATLLLFYAVDHWNSWFNALIFLDDKSKFPMQLILRSVVLLGRFEQSHEVADEVTSLIVPKTLKYATIMVSTLPILAVYPFVQKYFTKGITVGAIKG
jgi:putative aldouronate transport system permease protein